jgi:beta-lactamase regulating signal transducer with metallopeptidase domain
MKRKTTFRVANILTIVVCYLWYNPAVHIAAVRVLS